MVSRPESTPGWLIPFRNILQLEEDRGFDDGAVVGGLDRFLQRWASEMASYLNEPQAVDGLFHHAYASMSPEERREWVVKRRGILASVTEERPGDFVIRRIARCSGPSYQGGNNRR